MRIRIALSVFVLAITAALAQPPAQSEVEKLIEELNHKTFANRQAATKRLVELGEKVLPSLAKAMKRPEPEIRKRAEQAFLEISEAFSRKFLIHEWQAHTNNVNDLAFTADGKHLITVGWDGLANVWEVPSAKLAKSHQLNRAPMCVALIGDQCFVGGVPGVLTGSVLGDNELRTVLTGGKAAAARGIWSIVPLGSTECVVSTSYGGLERWDWKENKHLKTYEGFKARVWHAAVSPNAKYLAAGSGSVFDPAVEADNSIRLWNLSSGAPVKQFIGHTSDVRRLLFTQDGQHLVSCSFDKTIRFWNVESGKETKHSKAMRASSKPSSSLLTASGFILAVARYSKKANAHRAKIIRSLSGT